MIHPGPGPQNPTSSVAKSLELQKLLKQKLKTISDKVVDLSGVCSKKMQPRRAAAGTTAAGTAGGAGGGGGRGGGGGGGDEACAAFSSPHVSTVTLELYSILNPLACKHFVASQVKILWKLLPKVKNKPMSCGPRTKGHCWPWHLAVTIMNASNHERRITTTSHKLAFRTQLRHGEARRG